MSTLSHVELGMVPRNRSGYCQSMYYYLYAIDVGGAVGMIVGRLWAVELESGSVRVGFIIVRLN